MNRLINDAGAEVYSQKLGASTGSHTIETKSLSQIIYLCAINANGTMMRKQKINIAHGVIANEIYVRCRIIT